MKTLAEVFPTIDLYPPAIGEVAVVVIPDAGFDKEALGSRAAALQERHQIPLPAPATVGRRMSSRWQRRERVLITDDFAPVNLYDTIGKLPRPRK